MPAGSPPPVTAAQMREVDRVATEEFGLPLLSMMENAGRGLAVLVGRKLGSLSGRRVLCLAGKGGNGGGGLAACRHLANSGARVVAIAEEPSSGSAPEIQRRILAAAGVAVAGVEDRSRIRPATFDVVLDAVIGYGLSGNPRGSAARLVDMANRGRLRIALDLPSGLDATTGVAYRPCVRAHATLTLALPKVGLLKAEAKRYVGQLWLADIGIPPAVYRRLGIDVPVLFRRPATIRRIH